MSGHNTECVERQGHCFSEKLKSPCHWVVAVQCCRSMAEEHLRVSMVSWLEPQHIWQILRWAFQLGLHDLSSSYNICINSRCLFCFMVIFFTIRKSICSILLIVKIRWCLGISWSSLLALILPYPLILAICWFRVQSYTYCAFTTGCLNTVYTGFLHTF